MLARRTLASLVGALALASGACGQEAPTLAAECTEGPETIAHALLKAPAAVSLPRGTRLSACVANARSDAELQEIGIVYTRVADRLARTVQRDDGAAVQLGYLIGATRRGARQTSGIHEELVRRLEQTPGLDGAPPARRRALQRGLTAGASTG